MGAEVVDCVFKRHAVEVAQFGESGDEGSGILRVQQGRGRGGAFVYLLVLHILADLVDDLPEAHGFHDVSHHIALAYERRRLGIEVGTVRLNHHGLHLAFGVRLPFGSVVGALLFRFLFRGFL